MGLVMQHPRNALLRSSLVIATAALLGAGDPPAAPAAPAKPADPPAKKVVPPAVPGDFILNCAPQTGLPREKLKFFGEEFNCELCLDDASRTTGMGARAEFPAGTAMIFVHTKPALMSYWMKDCLVDIDIVFVDADGKIAAMHQAKHQMLRAKGQMLEGYEGGLLRYSSNRRVKYALEFPPGTIERLKPTLGQKIEIDWASLDKRAK